MIALCRVHADQADGGAFTDDQLRELKREGRERAEAIRGEFNWMRRDLLAIVGGNFYPNPRIILEVGGRPLVWFDRDEDGNLLLNFWMLSSDGSRRARILGNVWIVPPDVADLECPPRGRILDVRYANGYRFRVEFFNVDSLEGLRARHPDINDQYLGSLSYPLTAVEVWEVAPGARIQLSPRETRLPGATLRGVVVEGAATAISLKLDPGIGGPAFRDEELDLSDLVFDDHPFLEQARFENCTIYGPGIIALVRSSLIQPRTDGPPGAYMWRYPVEGWLPAGSVVAVGCVFDHCEFVNIGFALSDEEIRALGGPSPGQASISPTLQEPPEPL